MASTAVSRNQDPHKNPQLQRVEAPRSGGAGRRSGAERDAPRVSGDTRKATRGDDRVVVEVGCGVVVYPARGPGSRWRAVWYPVIGGVACQDIKTGHMQEAVNAAPTPGEGDRVRRCISALVGVGIAGGYLTSPRLKLVHWQPGEDRPVAALAVSVAGESALFVDPSEIPASIDSLGHNAAAGRQGAVVSSLSRFATAGSVYVRSLVIASAIRGSLAFSNIP